MNGQWVGDYDGPHYPAKIIANIDELRDCFAGVAYLLPDDRKRWPTAATFFRTPDKGTTVKFRGDNMAIDPRTNNPASWEAVKSQYESDIHFSPSFEIEATWTKDRLHLAWMGEQGSGGTCTLAGSMAGAPSDLIPIYHSWNSFKTTAIDAWDHRRFLFRGQNRPGRLRTTFHRTGRAELLRFLREDIPMLHKHLSARTRHIFNLEIPNENGAFFNLVQHHGYPTPLLDWSYSPYVAAYFAYKGLSNIEADKAGLDQRVRVLIFDAQRWRSDLNQLLRLANPGLHLSINEFIAIENERMIPQQAATTVTNIDDIESYIRSKESATCQYLTAIDLPLRERRRVMRELSAMGITAGSLFPGLDGACKELAERNFDL